MQFLNLATHLHEYIFDSIDFSASVVCSNVNYRPERVFTYCGFNTKQLFSPGSRLRGGTLKIVKSKRERNVFFKQCQQAAR